MNTIAASFEGKLQRRETSELLVPHVSTHVHARDQERRLTPAMLVLTLLLPLWLQRPGEEANDRPQQVNPTAKPRRIHREFSIIVVIATSQIPGGTEY